MPGEGFRFGDPPFEEQFAVKGTSESVARSGLDARLRHFLLQLHPVSVLVKRHKKSGTRYLLWELGKVEKDAERLKALFTLFGLLLVGLADARLATEEGLAPSS